MAETETLERQSETRPPPRRRRRYILAAAGLLLFPVAMGTAALSWLDTEDGRAWVARKIAALETESGFSMRISDLKGSLFGSLTAVDVRLYDTRGEWARIPSLDLRWTPWDLTRRSLSIHRVHAQQLIIERRPVFRPTRSDAPLWPDADIRIGRLRVDELILEEAAAGRRFVLQLDSRLDMEPHAGTIKLDVGSKDTADELLISATIQPDHNIFDIDARISAPAGGAIAGYLNARSGFALTAKGDGSWKRWRGQLNASLGNDRLVDLALAEDAGRFQVNGAILPASGLSPLMQRITHGPARITLDTAVKDRELSGTLIYKSSALHIDGRAQVDLDSGELTETRATARLLNPSLFASKLRLVDLVADIQATGSAREPQLAILAKAKRMDVGTTAILAPQISAKAHRTIAGEKRLFVMPVEMRVSRTQGLGTFLDRRLANTRLSSILTIDPMDAAFRVDNGKLQAPDTNLTITGLALLKKQHYRFGVQGALSNLVVPGFARAAIGTKLTIAADRFSERPTLSGTVTTQRIEPLNATAESLLGRQARLSGALAMTRQGHVSLRDVRLTGRNVGLHGGLTLGARRQLTGRVDGTISIPSDGTYPADARRVAHVNAAIGGTLSRPEFDVSARQAEALVAGQRLTDILLSAHFATDAAQINGSAKSPLGDVDARSDIAIGDDLHLRNLRVALGRVAMHGALMRPRNAVWQGQLQIEGGGLSGRITIPGSPAVPASADIDIRGNNVQLGQAKVGATISRLHAKGQIGFANRIPGFDGNIAMERAAFGQLRLDQLTLAGRPEGQGTRLQVTAKGSRGAPFSIDGTAQVQPSLIRLSGGGRYAGETIKLLQPAELTLPASGGWQLRPTEIGLANGVLSLEATWLADQRDIRLKANRISAGLLDLVRPGLGIDGQLSGTLSVSRSGQGLPLAEADLIVDNMRRAGLVGRTTPVDLRFVAHASGQEARGTVTAQEGTQKVGSFDWRLSSLSYQPMSLLPSNWQSAPLSGGISWRGRVDPIWALTGIEANDVSGPVSVDAQLGGTLGSPDLTGRIRSSGAAYENLDSGLRVTKIQVEAAFKGPRIEVSRLQGEAGRNGRVSATGWVELSAEKRFPAEVFIRADKAAVMRRDDIRAWGTGEAKLTHGPEGGLLQGKLAVTEARVQMGGAVAANPVPRIAYEEVGAEQLPVSGPVRRAEAKPFRLDLQVRAQDQVILEGMGLHSEWQGTLGLGGRAGAPTLTGRLDLVRGSYEFSGREFRLDRGQIIFRGESQPDPMLDIVASHSLDGVTIQIKIGGTAKRPEVTFTSQPQLPQEEILARLLFGESVPNLSAAEAVQLGAALSTLRGGDGDLNFVGRVGKAVGIDRLRVLPGDREKGIGTTVSGGKYITDRIYVEVATDGRGYTATLVEVDLTRTLSILSQVATLGSTNVSLKWSKDY